MRFTMSQCRNIAQVSTVHRVLAFIRPALTCVELFFYQLLCAHAHLGLPRAAQIYPKFGPFDP